MKEKKTLSLQKTIMHIVLVAYIVLVLLLVWMDYYLVRSYQNEIRSRESRTIDTVLEEISESMEYVKRTLYDLYTNNEEFSVLTRGADAAEAYSCAYDLRQTVTNQMTVDDRWHGFYLFYNHNRELLYYVNTNKVPVSDASRIYQLLKGSAVIEDDARIRNWGSFSIDDRVYLIMGMKKGEAAIYGLINLTGAEKQISENISREVQLCLADQGVEMRYPELFRNLHVSEYLKNAETQFEDAVYGTYMRGVKLDGSQMWGVVIYPLTWKDYISIFQMALLALTLFSCVAAVYIYRFLKKNMVQSLDDLRLKMEAIRRNSNNRFLALSSRFSELHEVNETLDVMVEELEQQKMKTYEEYIEKQKAQMQFLQLQMKPHFYLNGLKALNALVLNGQMENVQTLIFNLSEHFRYLLHQEAETVQLAKEIQFAENYCRIMDQMTGRRVLFRVSVPEEALLFQVPVLSVQTFAENSVKYARMGSVSSLLEISLEVCLLETEEGRYADLVISDNGAGYDPAVLESINGRQIDSTVNIGINNLKKRCSILYGERAEFTFRNRKGAYSELIIPEYMEG